MSNFQANVPLVNTKLVDQSGNITEAWFIFLIQLWRRTGGSTPPPSTPITINDVLALEETFGITAPSSFDVKKLAMANEMTFAPPSLDIRKLAMANEMTLASIVPIASKSVEMTLAPTAPVASKYVDMIFPPLGPQMVDETFVGGVDYTAGTTTVLTLKESFSSSARLWVFFDAVFQGDDQYSLSGTSLTFTSAIPVGVQKVYVKGLR